MKKKISDYLPKNKEKQVLINFQIDESLGIALKSKLKSNKVKIREFFNSVVDAYVKEK